MPVNEVLGKTRLKKRKTEFPYSNLLESHRHSFSFKLRIL